MKVIISDEVVCKLYCDSHQVWKLHKLLNYIHEGRHCVIFSPIGRKMCLDTIGEACKAAYASVLDIVLRKAALMAEDVATVRVDVVEEVQWGDPESILDIDNALELLDEPLGVLVENSENDWVFLQGMMKPSDRESINRAYNRGWAVPLHGGGNTIRKQLMSRLSKQIQAWRTFVMFDSDRLHPEEFDEGWPPAEQPGLPKPECLALELERIALASIPMRYWMLRRRFIESYMPRSEMIVSNPAHGDAIEVLFDKLNDNQRWFFNMKNGFNGDDRRVDKGRVKNLYDALDPTNRDILARGFGGNLADHYQHSIAREFNWDDQARQEFSEIVARLIRLI